MKQINLYSYILYSTVQYCTPDYRQCYTLLHSMNVCLQGGAPWGLHRHPPKSFVGDVETGSP